MKNRASPVQSTGYQCTSSTWSFFCTKVTTYGLANIPLRVQAATRTSAEGPLETQRRCRESCVPPPTGLDTLQACGHRQSSQPQGLVQLRGSSVTHLLQQKTKFNDSLVLFPSRLSSHGARVHATPGSKYVNEAPLAKLLHQQGPQEQLSGARP